MRTVPPGLGPEPFELMQPVHTYSGLHPHVNKNRVSESRLSNGAWMQHEATPVWNQVNDGPSLHSTSQFGDFLEQKPQEELFWQQSLHEIQPVAQAGAATRTDLDVGNQHTKAKDEEDGGWEVAGPKHLKGLKSVDEQEESFGQNLAILLSEQNGEPLNAANLPQVYQQRFGTKIPLSSGQKLKQLLQAEADKGICGLEEKEAGVPPTPVLFVRLLGSRTGLKEGAFTGVAGYLFTCNSESEKTCLERSVLLASAKELRSLRRDAGPTTKLFLCNEDTGVVHGPWLPFGEPTLSNLSTSPHGKFPAQMRVRPDPDFLLRSVPASALSWGRQKIPAGILAPRRIEELCQGGAGSSGHIVRSPPGPSYRCKWCGKEGGQPDSHWHQACEYHPDNRGGR